MLESKNIDMPDEKHTFDHGEVQVVHLPGFTVGRAVFRPGWTWSGDVKPVVGTASCQVTHTSIVLSGQFGVRMDHGEERVLRPGDAHVVSAGHDAWVVGDEPCVTLDFAATGDVVQGRVGRCPCGVELRIADEAHVDHLVEAIREHALGSHGHALSREDVLAELGVGR